MVQNRSRRSILYLVIAVVLTTTIITVWNITNYLDTSKYSSNILSGVPETPKHLHKRSLDLPQNDLSKLIDLDNFQFLINHECSNAAPNLIILAYSKPSNEKLRRIIRQTWGSITDNQFKLFFLFGVPKTEEDQITLNTENEEYGDVLQGNFIEAYDNLTYKHVMALKWSIYFCPNAKYVLKCDDDMFINTPALIKYVNDQLIPHGRQKLMLCSIWRKSLVYRKNSKYTVSYAEYPDKYYPPFCSGYFILYSPDVIFELYKQAQSSRYFRLEDVHVTGILARKANLTQTSFQKFILSKKSDIPKVAKRTRAQNTFLVGPKQLTPKEIEILWKATNFN